MDKVLIKQRLSTLVYLANISHTMSRINWLLRYNEVGLQVAIINFNRDFVHIPTTVQVGTKQARQLQNYSLKHDFWNPSIPQLSFLIIEFID